MDWHAAAIRAQEPHRTEILAASVDLWCAYLEARAHLAHLARALDEETRVAEQAAGPILDNLGVTLDLDEGDLPTSAVVLTKVVKADGSVSLLYSPSEGMSWIEAIGLITAGSDIVRHGCPHVDEDDD